MTDGPVPEPVSRTGEVLWHCAMSLDGFVVGVDQSGLEIVVARTHV